MHVFRKMANLLVTCITFTSLLSGFDTAPFTISDEHFSLAEQPLKIAAFNVQVFGLTKLGKPDVMEILKEIILKYDIIVIQEIRDVSLTVPGAVLDLINSPERPYGLCVSDRLGRTSSKEQYAFYYRTDKVTVEETYQYTDEFDYFERPPFTVRFSSPNTEISDFGIMAIHAKPSSAEDETSRLVDVYEVLRSRWDIDDILIAGDMNADCSYITTNEWPSVELRTDSKFQWLIEDDIDTTVSSTDCAYDRLVAAGTALKNAVIESSAGIYRFDEDMGLNYEQTEDVSDHYPVDMQIKAKSEPGLKLETQ